MPAGPHRTERDLALETIRGLQAAGHAAYFVGGCVRDLLLHRVPQDYDIATSATPAAVKRLFRHTKPVGRKFGVMLVIEDSLCVQVATFRGEADAPGDHRSDAACRDFTINALFFDPLTGTVGDTVGGRADLNARLIRTVGSAEERFKADPLRLLRAVRLAAQLDFAIEPATLQAIRAHAPLMRDTSVERVREELARIFKPPHAGRGLALLNAAALLPHALPEVADGAWLHTRSYEVAIEQLCDRLAALPPGTAETEPWVELLHGLAGVAAAPSAGATAGASAQSGVASVEAVLKRLRFSTVQVRQIVKAVRERWLTDSAK